MSTPPIRPERSFECYSRGAELVRAIRNLWQANRDLPPGSNDEIERRISALRADFDLTLPEWHHWCRAAGPGPDLPPGERARCTHPERTMDPSGRYSTCPACMLDYLAAQVPDVPADDDRPHVRMVFERPISRRDAAAIAVAMNQPALIGIEGPGLGVQVGLADRAVQVYHDDPLVLLQATERFAAAEWRPERRFRVSYGDGYDEPYEATLAELQRDNPEVPDLIAELGKLETGASITTGGGAAAEITITRIG